MQDCRLLPIIGYVGWKCHHHSNESSPGECSGSISTKIPPCKNGLNLSNDNITPLTMQLWFTLGKKIQWNEQYCRAKPCIAERTLGIPRFSCRLERSIHICSSLGLPHIRSGLCCVTNPLANHFTTCLYTGRETHWGFFLPYHTHTFFVKKKEGHYQSLRVSEPQLRYLSDLLEGSVALWKSWIHQRGGGGEKRKKRLVSLSSIPH